MREILFRAKRLDNGEWIYGDLLTPTDIMDVWEISENTGMGDRYEIDPETVGQYTGLKDRNGNKIFEGDIVQYQPEYATEPIHSVVEYCADKFNYPAFDLKNHDYEANGLQCAHEESVVCEVIGNIHDNSALLGDD